MSYQVWHDMNDGMTQIKLLIANYQLLIDYNLKPNTYLKSKANN